MHPVEQRGNSRIVRGDGRAYGHRNRARHGQIILLLADERDVREICVDERRRSGTGSEAGQQRPVRSANSRRRLIHQQTQSAQQSSSFCALDIRPGNRGQESLQLKIEAIFQSQCDRVGERKIKLPRPDQFEDPGRVLKAHRRDIARSVGAGDPASPPGCIWRMDLR